MKHTDSTIPLSDRTRKTLWGIHNGYGFRLTPDNDRLAFQTKAEALAWLRSNREPLDYWTKVKSFMV